MDSEPLIKNAASKRESKKAKDFLSKKEREHVEDLKWIFSSRAGRRFYWDLMVHCGIFKTSMTGTSQTFFNEGRRNVGLKLISELNLADPEAYLKMITEEKDEQHDS